MGPKQSVTNSISPGKRNCDMKESETTPKKIPKREAASPGRNREIDNLAINIGSRPEIMKRRTTRSGRELIADPELAGTSKPRLEFASDDSDKENRGYKQRNTRGKGTKKPGTSVTPVKMELNAYSADDFIEQSDRSSDEDYKMSVDSPKQSPKKSRRLTAPRAATQNERTPHKGTRTVAEQATPGLSNLTEMMSIAAGTPSRNTRSGRGKTLFGVPITTETNGSDLEKLKRDRAQTAKKTSHRKLVIETPTTSSHTHLKKDLSIERLRSVLHTSAVPEHLPCRDEEYEKIKKFVLNAVGPKASSQAMYISGVPGTGKTASTKAVIQALEKKNKFTYIYINAMEFLDPKQIFVHIYKSLTGEERVISAQNARKKLNFMLSMYDCKRKPVLMLVDELDQLSSRRQEIIYDIFNWTTVEQARVSVIAIANTLDLPERMLSQKISSRLGTNRIIFQPYEFQQIEEIIQSRIQEFSDIVSPDAVQLAARRVAAISGDLRKAIDTLRRSVEIAISKGSPTLALQHVLDAHKEATSVALVLIVCNLSKHEELVLSAAVNQVRSKGVEEFNFAGLYREYRVLCTSREGIEPWHDLGIHSLVMKMATSRLIIASPGKNMMLRKLRLGMLLQEAEMALKERNNQQKEREAGTIN